MKKPIATLKAILVDEFTRGYIACALWSSNDESTPQGGEPMDSNYSITDIAPETLAQMCADCADFQSTHGALLAQAYEHPYEAQRAGHDFWLTRNGHGAGFWDRDEIPRELGALLTAASKQYKDVDLYIGDDGKIYS